MGKRRIEIEEGFELSGKVLPEPEVLFELESQRIPYRYIGITESYDVSHASYRMLADRLLKIADNHKCTLFVCGVSTDREFEIRMGYWRLHPVLKSWPEDARTFPWIAAADNFVAPWSNGIQRLCSLLPIDSPEEFGDLLEISIYRNAIFILGDVTAEEVKQKLITILKPYNCALSRSQFLKIMINQLPREYPFAFVCGGFDSGGAYVSIINGPLSPQS